MYLRYMSLFYFIKNYVTFQHFSLWHKSTYYNLYGFILRNIATEYYTFEYFTTTEEKKKYAPRM